MFLEFQKINTTYPSSKTPIIVNSDTIFKITTETFENKETGHDYEATRIDVLGIPKYTFHTTVPLNAVLGYLKIVDATSGVLIPGTPCVGGNEVQIYYPTPSYPFVKAKAIFNSTITETKDYVFNPQFMIYAESMIFNDVTTHSQQTALVIALQDSPAQVMTKLSYSVLAQLLTPTPVV